MRDDTWEGGFGWQEYAVTGRPDLLNYIHHGDVTWEQVWRYCRERPVPQDALLRLCSLFHGFLSGVYDQEGCWLDPDGEVCRELRSWVAFAFETGDALGEEQVLCTLGQLLDGSVISRLYYEAAFTVYTEAVLDGYASHWPRDRSRVLALAGANRDDGTARTEVDRVLPVYTPDSARFGTLGDDPEWERCVERVVERHYRSWNQVYVASAPDSEMEEQLQDDGGEG